MTNEMLFSKWTKDLLSFLDKRKKWNYQTFCFSQKSYNATYYGKVYSILNGNHNQTEGRFNQSAKTTSSYRINIQ